MSSIAHNNHMKAIEQLRQMWFDDQCQRFPAVTPTMSAHAVPKFTDRTANGLQKCILQWLRLNGHQAERINTMGRQIKTKSGKQIYIQTTGSKGSADISATINGRSVKIEVKIAHDRQSDAQRRYQDDVTRAGGVYIIARTFEDFIRDYYQLLINNI